MAVPVDPYAYEYKTEDGIAKIADRIKNGQYQFGRDDQAAIAIKAWNAAFKRNPTPDEVQDVLVFNGGAINDYVSNKKQQYDSNPENIRKGIEEKGPQFYGSVDQSFQSVLGRAATDQEKDHFGKLLASGDLDTYTLGTFLQQLPENVSKQDAEFRKNLSTELQSQDSQYYKDAVLPAIGADFSARGRSIDSSGYAAATAQAARLQGQDREKFLSNLSAQQYAGRQGAAREDYLTNLSRTYGAQDYRQNRSDMLADRSQQRLYDVQDFNTQAQIYENYLKRYGKKSGGIGGLIGGLVGAGAGAYFGGPMGANVGYQMGSGTGSYFDS